MAFADIKSSREDFSLLAARPVRRFSDIFPLHGPVHIKTESPQTLRFLSFPLQYTTAVRVLINVATIAGAIIPAGFTLPYWLR